jgi:hypothetical protein
MPKTTSIGSQSTSKGIHRKGDLLLALLYAGEKSKKGNDENSFPIEGITRLEKLLFLLKYESGFLSEESKENETLHFIAYKMGPWTNEVYDELDFFESLKIIKKEKEKKQIPADSASYEQLIFNAIIDKYQQSPEAEGKVSAELFSLTERGKEIVREKIWDKLTEDDKGKLREIKKKYNSMKLNELLRYVYNTYPDFATKSEIKDTLGLQ